MLELLNTDAPYSMSQYQFGVAMDVNSIGALAREIRDQITASYPPPPEPPKGEQR